MKFKNVYVVDDDKIHHFLVKKLLEKNGIEASPSFFENGELALNAIKEAIEKGSDAPDLILLDINMPILDGWQFLEEFKLIKNKLKNSITIHVVSSSTDMIDIEKSEKFKSDIHHYYTKPMTLDVINNIFNN